MLRTTVCGNDILASVFSFLHSGNEVERRVRDGEMAVADDKGAVVGRQGQDERRKIRGAEERDDPCDV